MPRKFMITGALPYSNGRLHVGHVAGAYLPADIYVRYLRANGDDVRFVCGSDDHGVAIPITAAKEGKTPQEVSSLYNGKQKTDFEGLGIQFDIYGGTHQPGFAELHAKFSQHFFKKVFDNGYFTKKTTRQLYDAQAGKFLPDRYVKGTCPHCKHPNAYGDQCENCGQSLDPLMLIDPISTITNTVPEVRETVHWYMQLGQFNEKLKEYLGLHANWRPQVLNFARGLLAEGLPERAMTRDLEWGIPVPLEDPDAKGKVLYVWFDAPIGYVSFTAQYEQNHGKSEDEYATWWKNRDCRVIHFIGEDNVIFHALIWPAMMMAEGSYRLPDEVVANSFLNIKFPGKEEEKISKSRGTAIWIEEYLRMFDPDPLRYYLTAIAPETQRTAFDVDEFIQRNNSELLAAFGNFINRILAFNAKTFDNKVPPQGTLDDADKAQMEMLRTFPARVAEQLEQYRFKAALGEVMELTRQANAYVNVKQPWKQKKTDLAACGTTVNICIQTIRCLMTLMQPFLPFSACKIAKMLQLDEPTAFAWAKAAEPLPAGHALGTPEVLFKKLEAKEIFGEQTAAG
jgi:methionyl-tRNA synthetase